ncbi:MAG: hypothetical protein ABI220_01330 [Candidatus Saccharimonadales bacterium]
MPLAFISHFVCDAVPHYDPPIEDGVKRLDSKRFLNELILSGLICLLIVLVLALTRPRNWVLAIVCAFLATSPDLFWIPRFVQVKRTHTDKPPRGWFLRFHSFIQWQTGPKLIWLELVWFVGFSALITLRL